MDRNRLRRVKEEERPLLTLAPKGVRLKRDVAFQFGLLPFFIHLVLERAATFHTCSTPERQVQLAWRPNV